jgi:TonB family protein
MSLLTTAPFAKADSAASTPETLHFDFPAQPLQAALAAYSRQTGLSVLVSSLLTDGRQAAAVHGDLDASSALRELLAGTRLDVRYISATAFTLVPVPDPTPATDSTIEPEATPSADRLNKSGYAAVIQRTVTRTLCLAQPEAFGRYRVGIQLWIDDTGLVRDARVLESSGVAERDASVLSRLRRLALDAPPPPGLAQPVTILLAPRPDPAADCRPFLAGGH